MNITTATQALDEYGCPVVFPEDFTDEQLFGITGTLYAHCEDGA